MGWAGGGQGLWAEEGVPPLPHTSQAPRSEVLGASKEELSWMGTGEAALPPRKWSVDFPVGGRCWQPGGPRGTHAAGFFGVLRAAGTIGAVRAPGL